MADHPNARTMPAASAPAGTGAAMGDYSAALAVLGPKMRVGTGKPQEVPSVTLT
jgi:hypothetical protein